MQKWRQFLIYILWNSVKGNFRIYSVVFFILFCDCWIFMAFCCSNYVLWPRSLPCPEACDSLLCFQRFSIKMIIQCMPLSFSGFFSVTMWWFHSIFDLNEQCSIKARYSKQNVLNVTMLKFPGLWAESKQHFKTSHWKNNTPNSHSLRSTTPSI